MKTFSFAEFQKRFTNFNNKLEKVTTGFEYI